jgi:8-oxo-dGTP pyrophosphatase MutT (NUDIX family)
MESRETLEEAAARETFEETGLRLDPGALRLYGVATLPEISEVYVGFLATVAEHADLVCGLECSEVRFFSEADVPWTEIAYADIGVYLREYFVERRCGAEAIHVGCLDSVNVIDKSYRIAAVAEARRPRIIPVNKSD